MFMMSTGRKWRLSSWGQAFASAESCLVPLWGICVFGLAALSAIEVAGGVQQVETFKRLLANSIPRFEVLYSVTSEQTQGGNEMIEKLRASGVNIRPRYNEERFTYVKLSSDGFVIRHANQLESLTSFDMSVPQTANGLSNGVFWSFGAGQVIYDHQRREQLLAKGIDWRESVFEAARPALTFGLNVQPGSVRWDGNTFQARYPDTDAWSPDVRGRELIRGELVMSNGLPARIEYRGVQKRYYVNYSYSPGKGQDWPDEFVISEFFDNRHVGLKKYRIVLRLAEDVTAGLITAADFEQHNAHKLRIFTKSASNQVSVTNYKGFKPRAPVPVRRATRMMMGIMIVLVAVGPLWVLIAQRIRNKRQSS